MKYSDKLKDPRWQKKRLEILQRDEFTCRLCGDSESPLVVHHLKYEGEPWEVDNDYLITYCESCHESEHGEKKKWMDSIKERLIFYTSSNLIDLDHLLFNINLVKYPPEVVYDSLLQLDCDKLVTSYFKMLKEEREERERNATES